MWYIIPTPPYVVDGVERGSGRNRHYASRSDREVREYLSLVADGVDLRMNYLTMMEAVRDRLRTGQKALSLFGPADEPKLKSSVRLFERATRGTDDDEFRAVLIEVMNLLRQPPDKNSSPYA